MDANRTDRDRDGWFDEITVEDCRMVALFVPAAPFFLLIHGKDTNIPAVHHVCSQFGKEIWIEPIPSQRTKSPGAGQKIFLT